MALSTTGHDPLFTAVTDSGLTGEATYDTEGKLELQELAIVGSFARAMVADPSYDAFG